MEEILIYTDNGWKSAPMPNTVELTVGEYRKLADDNNLEADTQYCVTDTGCIIDDLTEPLMYDTTVSTLIDKALRASFNCVYCGTQNFESAQAHTPHCPNCGALMRRI